MTAQGGESSGLLSRPFSVLQIRIACSCECWSRNTRFAEPLLIFLNEKSIIYSSSVGQGSYLFIPF